MASHRTLPQSLEAERCVLGSILLSPDTVIQAMEVLLPADFSRDAHTRIFEAMVRLASVGSAIDAVTLPEEIERTVGVEKVGGLGYLMSLTEGVPRALNVEHYVKIVKEKSLLRRLIFASDTIQRAAFSGESELADQLHDAEKLIFGVAESDIRSELTSLGRLSKDAVGYLGDIYASPNGITGLPSGFRSLDEMTTGLQGSDLIIVAARPSVGKSSWGADIALNAARQGRTVAFFSLEMSKRQVALRFIASEARVSFVRLRAGYLTMAEVGRVAEAIKRLVPLHLYVDDISSPRSTDIATKCRRLKSEHGLALVVVDYIQLMSESGAENRNLEVGVISRSMKALAKELDVPVVALAQLNRAIEKRPDRVPRLSDLRESGSLEMDADAVIFLDREELWDEFAERGVAKVIVAKQRNGPTGSIRLAFHADYMHFEEMR